MDKAGVDRDVKVKDWTDDQAARIREIIGAEYKVEGDLRSEVQLNIKQMCIRDRGYALLKEFGLPFKNSKKD